MAQLANRVASLSASAKAVRSPLPVAARSAAVRARTVRVRSADIEPQSDAALKFQEKVQDISKTLQAKWEETADAEKPAAVAIIIGSVIAQIAIGATVDAVHKLPLISNFLEFVGLVVVAVYGYRYFTEPSERDNVRTSINNFWGAVKGDNSPPSL
ncbi:CAAD domains of cyanobacterial aminoacyl-tRNA synthetase-domain-containing protein [Haematococcus lacustris]